MNSSRFDFVVFVSVFQY